MAVLLWEGKSAYNGEEIGILATLDSDNVKTGRSVQIWILLKSEAPHIAQKSGRDQAVCGTCANRPIAGGNCYVTTFQAPNSVWKAWRDGRLQKATVAEIKTIAKRHGLLRLGAYGDPALIPMPLLQELVDGVPHTGYTHMWREPWAADYRNYVMASADNSADAKEATGAGWRYFRVISQDSEPAKLPNEVICPASAEAGSKLTCSRCKACDGHSHGKSSNIVIKEH